MTLILMSFSLALASVCAQETNQTVRVGLYQNSPKIYTNENGTADGFFPALLEAIASKEGWNLNYVPGSWSNGLERLEQGTIDIMPDMAMTPDRLKRFAFGDETALISWAAVYTSTGLQVHSFFDLAGKRIGVLQGSVYDQGPGSIRDMMRQFNIPATFAEYDNYDAVFAALQAGEADAGIVNNIFGSAAEKRYRVTRTPIVFSPSRLHFAFPKNAPLTPRLKAATDRRLRALKADRSSLYYRAMDTYLYNTLAPQHDASNVLTAAEQAWLKAHPDIRLGYDPEFFPFEFRNDKGQFSGIAADYVDILERQFGIEMQVAENLDWSQVMDEVAHRKIDVLSCVGRTEERSAYLLYTQPYCQYQRVILTRSDMPFITGLDDVAHLRIGAQEATTHDAFLRESTEYSFITYPSMREAVLALSSGKIDALVGNLASSAYWIRHLNLTNLKIAAPASSEVYTLHFAVRKDWPELVSILNKCLARIDQMVREDIQQRWVNLEYEPEAAQRAAWRAVLRTTLIAAVVIALVLLWLSRLKREVQRRKSAEEHLRTYADQLETANRKLEEMDRLKNMFIASVSHELRTPLNSIIGFSGVLLKGMTGELQPKQKDQISRIYSSSQHLLALITDIIDISKIEASAVDVFPSEFSLDHLIGECIDLVQPQLARKPITLSVDCQEGVLLHTDRKRLRQCVINYLSNAIKYTESGSINLTARRAPDDSLKIAVKDTGIGIDPNDQPRLFEAFERMDSHLRVKAGGTGLGLYLTRKIVTEILQGTTAFQSALGIGSTFSLTIPIQLPAEKLSQSQPTEPDEASHD